jgi:hypothetical protein
MGYPDVSAGQAGNRNHLGQGNVVKVAGNGDSVTG